jgi:hypothetical protein
MLHNICNPLLWKKSEVFVWSFYLEGWCSRSMLVARVEQSILRDGQTAWQQPSDLQWTPLCVSLNFEWRENRLHLVTLTHSNIFKFKKPHPLCLCFLIRFSEEEAEATEDFDMSISRLFKNKITVGTSQLFNNCLFYRTPKCPALDFLSFLKITVYATGDIHM